MDCVCCEEISKYKCPTCRQPYCSVSCFKSHRAAPCSAPAAPPCSEPPPTHTTEWNFPTEDTVSPEKLLLLRDSAEVKECLKNPHLRSILETLDRAEHPDLAISKYMREPIFTEFVDACLVLVEKCEES